MTEQKAWRGPVIVTGAGGLLGSAFTEEVLRRGGSVIALDSDEVRLGNLAESMTVAERQGLQAHVVDVSDERGMDRLFREILSQSSPSALVNNAAINPKVEGNGLVSPTIDSFLYENFRDEMLIGLYSALSLSRSFVAHCGADSPEARYIVNIGSDFAHISPKQSIYREPGSDLENSTIKPVGYSMVKHGVHGLTKYLATYFAPQNVLVNTLSPGGVSNGQPAWFQENLKSEIPLGRMAAKEEIASALCALLSGDFSYMTGQEIIVDGGRAIW